MIAFGLHVAFRCWTWPCFGLYLYSDSVRISWSFPFFILVFLLVCVFRLYGILINQGPDSVILVFILGNSHCEYFKGPWGLRDDQIRSDQSLSRVRLFATPWIAARQASLSITTPGVHSDSRPSSQWCHPAISSSVIPFSSCPQFPPASESFPMSQVFAWGGQSTGVSALASFLPKIGP